MVSSTSHLRTMEVVEGLCSLPLLLIKKIVSIIKLRSVSDAKKYLKMKWRRTRLYLLKNKNMMMTTMVILVEVLQMTTDL